MGQVVAMPGDRCDEIDLLLPWHAADTLGADDAAMVERHLVSCVGCRRKLEMEHRIKELVRVEEASSTEGWRALELALDRHGQVAGDDCLAPALPPSRPARRRRLRWGAVGRIASDPRRLRWAVGAQFAALLVLGTVATLPAIRSGAREGPYRALGDAPSTGGRQGNVLVMFRPDVSEASLRRALTASGARLVDGPTEAGAWVLNVPGGPEGARLAKLREQPGVTMAEPIGEGPTE